MRVSRERLDYIVSYLHRQLIIHRDIEKTPWTAEEEMILDLFRAYTDLSNRLDNALYILEQFDAYLEPQDYKKIRQVLKLLKGDDIDE